MRLKTLQIQGYKSFANKVEFVFDTGVTAVVGPNGSGKSNVADAIRWVLGEQSYSTLRGKKTEDMIFSGSDGRARLGMASATLSFDNSDQWLPLDFAEVTLTRRAHRSGENEYFLNGSRVRLKDVAELLSKSGLSRQAYTVIGQGTVDRVLSLHAEERRKLFEEAAGITFHRQQRSETLARLEAARANLLRLNDILQEIKPRLHHRQKQALRAKEYLGLKEQLDGLLRTWYGYLWGQGQRSLHEATTSRQGSDARVTALRAEFARLSSEIDTLRAEQTKLRATLSSEYAENSRLRATTEATQRELAVSEERARQYAAQRDEILAEAQSMAADLEAQQVAVAEAEAALAQLNRDQAQAETALSKAQAKLNLQQVQQKELLARRAAADQEAARLAADLVQRQARLAQWEERREALLAEQANGTQEIATLTEQQQETRSQHGQLLVEIALLDEAVIALEAQQAAQRDQRAQLSQVNEQLKAKLAALQRQEGALKARQDILGRLRHEMAGYYGGVRAVLQANLAGVVGTVSQVIQPPPDLEVAIEAALGGRLQDIVVDSFAHAEAAIAYLKEGRRGRATFLPLDTIRYGPPLAVPPGVIGLASALVTVEPRLRPIAEMTLNRTAVVEDLPAARRAFKQIQGGFQIVTREGELMRSGGSVTGGQAGDAKNQPGGLLAREREWRELPGQLAALQADEQAILSRLAQQHAAGEGVEQKMEALSQERRQAESRRSALQTAANDRQRRLEQVANNLKWREEAQAKATAELEQLAQRRATAAQEIARLSEAQQAAAALAHKLTDEAQSLANEELLAELSRLNTAAATLLSRRKSQQELLAGRQAAVAQRVAQIENKGTRARLLASEREGLLVQQAVLQRDYDTANLKLQTLAGQISEMETKLADWTTQQSSLEQAVSSLRPRLQRAETEHNKASLEAARRQDELDTLQRHIQDDLGLAQLELTAEQVSQPLLPIPTLVFDLPTVTELPPGTEEEVKRLKLQISRLGQINPNAPREYAELQERHDFLTHQMADLEKAITDLKDVIAKLDGMMEAAFSQTFARVAVEFEGYFKTLFGGGEAKLLLTEPENGVDIVARPPGKRRQNLALLSGGERSLTAQALIFALLKTSPTPFVVFDEVDAMLDEANVGRFRDALTTLAREIQFIVITHNRKTIEAASTVYGISMGQDSVSKAYSLKVDDWTRTSRDLGQP
jgi:chromosome segregation protein